MMQEDRTTNQETIKALSLTQQRDEKHIPIRTRGANI